MPETGESEAGPWAAIWDQSALQTLTATFDSSAARDTESAGKVPNWSRKPGTWRHRPWVSITPLSSGDVPER